MNKFAIISSLAIAATLGSPAAFCRPPDGKLSVPANALPIHITPDDSAVKKIKPPKPVPLCVGNHACAGNHKPLPNLPSRS